MRDVLDYDKEKAYLEAMARGKYQPELLLSDYPGMAQRIAKSSGPPLEGGKCYCTFGAITEIEIA